MQKMWAASVYLNISLSVLFIVSVLFGLSSADKKNAEDWGFFIYFMLVFGIFLWLNLRCVKLSKYNKGLTGIKNFQRKLGKTIAVTAIVLAVILLLAAIAGFTIFTNDISKEQLRYGWLYTLLLSLLLVAGITAIVNAVYYFKALKMNTALVNDYINSIGA